MHWKCRLENGTQFASASMCKRFCDIVFQLPSTLRCGRQPVWLAWVLPRSSHDAHQHDHVRSTHFMARWRRMALWLLVKIESICLAYFILCYHDRTEIDTPFRSLWCHHLPMNLTTIWASPRDVGIYRSNMIQQRFQCWYQFLYSNGNVIILTKFPHWLHRTLSF